MQLCSTQYDSVYRINATATCRMTCAYFVVQAEYHILAARSHHVVSAELQTCIDPGASCFVLSLSLSQWLVCLVHLERFSFGRTCLEGDRVRPRQGSTHLVGAFVTQCFVVCTALWAALVK